MRLTLLNSPRAKLLVGALAILAMFALTQTGRAVTFNWPTSPAFPTGPTSGNSVSAVYSGLGSVTVTNVADAGTGVGATWQTGFPTVNNTTTTGGAAVNGLQFSVTNQSTVNSYVKVAINFGYTGGATNVSFTIWDVDYNSTQFRDKIANIVGVTPTGTLVAATVTNVGAGATNTITGSGTLSATATGSSTNTNTSANGNVTISFGATAIQSVQFQWFDSNGTRNTQQIGLSPITFTPVGSATPEVGSSFAALVLCLGVVGYGGMHRRRNSRSVG